MGGSSASPLQNRNTGVKLFGVNVESRLEVSRSSADDHDPCFGGTKPNAAGKTASSASTDRCTKVEPAVVSQPVDREERDDSFPEESDNSFIGGSADVATVGPRKMFHGDTEGFEAVASGSVSVRGSASSRERKKGIPWTEEEHRLFLLGLSKLGKGDWRGISRKYVQTRTPTQVASHAQKYFIRQSSLHKRKRRSSLFDISADSVLGDSSTMLRSASTPSLPTFPDDSPLGQSSALANNNPSRSFAPPPPPAPSSLTTPAQQLVASPTVPSNPLSSSLYSSSTIVDAFNRSQSFPAVPAYNSSFFLPPPAMSRPTSLPVLPPPPPSFFSDPPISDPAKPPWSSAAASTSATPLSSLNAAATAAAAAGALGASPVFAPSLSLSMSPYGLSSSDLAGMDPALRHRLGHEMMLRMGQELTQRMAVMAALTQTGISAGTGTGAGAGAGVWNRGGQPTERQSAEKRTRFSKEAEKPGNEPDGLARQATVTVEGANSDTTRGMLGSTGVDCESMNECKNIHGAPVGPVQELQSSLPSEHVPRSINMSLQGHHGYTSGLLTGRGLSPLPPAGAAAVAAAEAAVAGGIDVSHNSSPWPPYPHAHPQAYMAAMFQPSGLWANHASSPYGVLNPFQVASRPSWGGLSHLPSPASFPWTSVGNNYLPGRPQDKDGVTGAFSLASFDEALAVNQPTTVTPAPDAATDPAHRSERPTPAGRAPQEVAGGSGEADVKGKGGCVASRVKTGQVYRPTASLACTPVTLPVSRYSAAEGDVQVVSSAEEAVQESGGRGTCRKDERSMVQVSGEGASELNVPDGAGALSVEGSCAYKAGSQEQRGEEVDEEAVAAAATLQLLDAPSVLISNLHDRKTASYGGLECAGGEADGGEAAVKVAEAEAGAAVAAPAEPAPASIRPKAAEDGVEDGSEEAHAGMPSIPACMLGLPSRSRASPESSDLSPNPIALCNA